MATPRLASLRLKGADGLPLHVDVRTGAQPGEKRPAVVICHGFKGFKDWGFFPPAADRLARAGFTAVTFNFSGSGVAEGDQFTELERWAHQRPSHDLQDLGTVIDHVAEFGAPWIGLLGHSRGGGLAVLQAGRDARVKALVTWAAIDHFLRFSAADIERWRRTGSLDVLNTRTGQTLTIARDALDDIEAHRHDLLDVAGAAGRVVVPWLVAHGAADPTVEAATAGRLAAAAPGTARTLLVEGADHTFGSKHPWAGASPHFTQVMDATVSFLSRNL